MNNTKLKKVLTIIFFCLIAAVAITAGVFYIIFPTQTLNVIHQVWDFVNEPLPVLGFSIAFICFFAWKVFISTSFGLKKYNEIKRDYTGLDETLKVWIATYEKEKAELIERAERAERVSAALLEYINKIRDTIPNKKVKEIEVDQFYGEKEKETDNETRTD